MTPLAGRLDRCAINTATLGFQAPLEQSIEAVARAGFGAIAPWRAEVDETAPTATARRIRDAGLDVSGYCRSAYLPAATAEARAAAIADNRRAVEVAATLGAACFVLVVGGLPAGSRDLPAARAQVADGVAALLEHARACGVRLGLEPLHPVYAADRSCLNTLAHALDMAEALDPGPDPSLGVVIDAYHLWWDPDLPAQIARAGRAGRILGYHVSDWLTVTRDPLNDRGMMGDGVIDLPALRSLVEAAGYTGPVEVEIFSDRDWWRRPARETLATCASRLQTVC